MSAARAHAVPCRPVPKQRRLVLDVPAQLVLPAGLQPNQLNDDGVPHQHGHAVARRQERGRLVRVCVCTQGSSMGGAWPCACLQSTPAAGSCRHSRHSFSTLTHLPSPAHAARSLNKPGYRYVKTSNAAYAVACGANEYSAGLKKQASCDQCPPNFVTDADSTVGSHTSSASCGGLAARADGAQQPGCQAADLC